MKCENKTHFLILCAFSFWIEHIKIRQYIFKLYRIDDANQNVFISH